MKKILGLLLVSSSIFSMELQVARPSKFHAQYKSSDISKAAFAKAITPHAPFTIPNQHTASDKVDVKNEVDIKKVRIDPSSVHVPHDLQGLELYHGKKGFVALHKDKKHVIDPCLMDQIARSIKQEQLQSFINNGYFSVNETNDGCLTLKAHNRVAGGGPLAGKIAYWTTKVACYSVLIAATAAIVYSGGAVGISVCKGDNGPDVSTFTANTAKNAMYAASASAPAFSSVAAVTTTNASIAALLETSTSMAAGSSAVAIGTIGTNATITAETGAAIFSGVGLTTGMGASGIVANEIIKNGHAPDCAKAVGAALATGSNGSGIVAGIEYLSLTVGLFFGLTPTP